MDHLFNVLWSYRTSPRDPTGETPFALCYGLEAIIPIEIGERNFRMEELTPVNEQELRVNLDLLPERQEHAYLRMMACQLKMARFHNRRVREMKFEKGELVLRKSEVSTQETGKLHAN